MSFILCPLNNFNESSTHITKELKDGVSLPIMNCWAILAKDVVTFLIEEKKEYTKENGNRIISAAVSAH